ncbi:MAG: DNA replication/repair protein RecF [Candidatus Dadabacteria bacterium]|nr:MAG: DNA replication/repair protein RecF [Candidatus Dadabacteria bacterium]
MGVSYGEKTKKSYINNKPVRGLENFIGSFLAVVFTPDDLGLVKGQPSLRRSFTDKYISFQDKGFISSAVSYRRALKHKSVVLREGRRKEELLALNAILAKHGSEVIYKRKLFIEMLNKISKKYYRKVSGDREILELSYKAKIAGMDRAEIEENLYRGFDEALDEEVRAKKSLIGPHRDDIKIEISGVDARYFASQGQVRSVVLSLKLAIIEMLREKTSDTPVVLLDDVDSELDRNRKRIFYEELFSGENQIFVTGTEISREVLEMNRTIGKYKVVEGNISRI